MSVTKCSKFLQSQKTSMWRLLFPTSNFNLIKVWFWLIKMQKLYRLHLNSKVLNSTKSSSTSQLKIRSKAIWWIEKSKNSKQLNRWVNLLLTLNIQLTRRCSKQVCLKNLVLPWVKANLCHIGTSGKWMSNIWHRSKSKDGSKQTKKLSSSDKRSPLCSKCNILSNSATKKWWDKKCRNREKLLESSRLSSQMSLIRICQSS